MSKSEIETDRWRVAPSSRKNCRGMRELTNIFRSKEKGLDIRTGDRGCEYGRARTIRRKEGSQIRDGVRRIGEEWRSVGQAGRDAYGRVA